MSDTNDAADFAAALTAAASAAEETPDATTSESDAGDVADASDGEAEGTADASGEGTDTDDGDDAGDDDGQAEDDEDGAAVASIRQKFIDGDLEDALKDLGVDPKVLGVNGPKIIAMRKGLKEAKETKARADLVFKQAADKELNAKAIIEDGRKTYGHLVDLKHALRLGDFTAARDLLEGLAPEGTTYKQIAEGLAKAAAGQSPSEVLYRKKLREMAEKERKDAEAAEAAKTETATKQTSAQLAEKNLAGAKALIAKTGLADIPGAAEALVRLAAENWDPVKKGLKVPKADLVKLVEKDPVISQLLELKRLKAKGGKPKAETPAASTPTTREKSGRFTSRRTPVVDPKAKEKDEFAAAMAEATRMEAADRRSRNAGKGRR